MSNVQCLDSDETTKRIRQLAQDRANQHIEDVRELMRSSVGRRVVYWLINEVCDINGPSFSHSIKDGACAAQHSANHDGVRSVGIFLQNHMREHCMDDYLSMIVDETRSRQLALSLKSHTPGPGKAKT